jgi:ribonuclease D
MIIHIGFDMEWEFSVGQSACGPHKTALLQLANSAVIYLLRTHLLKTLPNSLKTILSSPQLIKVGRNVGADLAKLARDFPGFIPPKKDKKGQVGVLELGAFAKAKNAVLDGHASLATITAATLGLNLSKEACSSEWGALMLSEEQKHYAALDAWISLEIWRSLKDQPNHGSPLKSAAPVGQKISVYERKQEVARGVIVVQPHQFSLMKSLVGGSST